MAVLLGLEMLAGIPLADGQIHILHHCPSLIKYSSMSFAS